MYVWHFYNFNVETYSLYSVYRVTHAAVDREGLGSLPTKFFYPRAFFSNYQPAHNQLKRTLGTQNPKEQKQSENKVTEFILRTKDSFFWCM